MNSVMEMNPPAAAIADVPKETLRQIVVRNGESILNDPSRCEGLLKDHCGTHRREISALVGALEERIPAELKGSWRSSMTPEAMRARMVQRLLDNRGLAPEVANWAVDAWSYALGIGLARSAERLASHVVQPVAAGMAGAAGAGGWVGSQVMQPPHQAHQQQLPVAEAFQLQNGAGAAGTGEKKSGGAWKVGAAIAALAVAGYFLAARIVMPCAQQSLNGCIEQPDPSKVDPKNADPNKTDPGKQNPQQPKKQSQQQPAPLVPLGARFDVRVNVDLSSATAVAGAAVEGTLVQPVMKDGQVVFPRGSRVVLGVDSVDPAGKLAGVPKIVLSLRQIDANGRSYQVHSRQFTVKGSSRTVNTVTKTAAGAGIGCAVGGVLGKVGFHRGGKGCAIGAGAGGATGGVVAAKQEIKPAVVQAGTNLGFQLSEPIAAA